jgi:hypothetical protein
MGGRCRGAARALERRRLIGTDADRRTLEGLFGDGGPTLSAEDEHDLRSDDYVMAMPVRRADRRTGQDAGLPACRSQPAEHQGSGASWERDLFVVEGVSDDGDQVAHVADIVEFDPDGRIRRETRYCAAPVDPPAWRARWVERTSDTT